MGLWGAIKKAINSDLSLPLDANLDKGYPLQNMFGWAGGRYPFAGATDVTISANTTWDNTTHPQGFAKVKKLTINAGRTLTIRKSPFFIFAEEISGGGANAKIDASGPNGAASGNFTCEQAWGGTESDGTGRIQGGCGGGFLVIVCNKFSGSAITIKANGGNGWANYGKSSNSYYIGVGGQGALSETKNNQSGSENWYGAATLFPRLARGGGTNGGQNGGSGGGGTSTYGGGGSGIGGGSGSGSGGEAAIPSSLNQLLTLALAGCKGGGGGSGHMAPSTQPVGWMNHAGGGGGGCILAICNDASSVTPTLQADGGVDGIPEDGTSPVNSGGAGITIYVNFAA